MLKKRYQLKNHFQEKNKTEIYATIELQPSRLKIEYEIINNLSSYHFPKETKQQRANELWRDTCFELFIANHSSTEYYELNISPSTQWNAYHFKSYKEEMRETDVFSTPSIISHQLDKSYNLSFEMAFQEDIFVKKLSINLAVILLDKEEMRHFYAINRCKESPDFHDRFYHVCI
ncbi:hypothetical protein MNB_SV-12-26 [hydrothermal vent metagenome]|uniref:DOMON-like domain-containing protein n=1 Tax=hydrothermal vent metagenome TaxID=652676 RepID=A0A1W1BAF9_9ZZZZ